jgi:moderate conductance mechanosensitive channel
MTPVSKWKELFQGWDQDTINFVRNSLPKLVVVLIGTIVLIRLLRLITAKVVSLTKNEQLASHLRTQQLRTLVSVVNSVGTVVIFFIALLEVLKLFNISIEPLLASAGIVGLAIGFGAQTLVKDVITGFFILLENQYDLGDTIKIAGVTGTVEEMSLRRTLLRDANGTVHSVPNSEIKIVSNLTRDWSQVSIAVAVDYNEPSDKVIRLLQEIGEELRYDPNFGDAIVAEPEVPGIERVQGSEVDYLVLTKVRPGKQYAVSRELRRRIKDCFEKNKIKPGGPSRIYIPENAPAEES